MSKCSTGLSAGNSIFWRDLLIYVEDDHELSAGLKRLMGLLFLNIGELVGDEAWLSGQLAAMHNLMAGDLHAEKRKREAGWGENQPVFEEV